MDLELIRSLMALVKRGVGVVDGHPYIHGQPAEWDDEPPLLDCLSQWRCPHCKSNLSRDTFICLNACHLTVPEYRTFQAQLAEATARVERRRGILNDMQRKTYGCECHFDGYDLDYDPVIIPFNFRMTADSLAIENLGPLDQILETVRGQIHTGHWGIGFKVGVGYFAAFQNEDDATILKLTLT